MRVRFLIVVLSLAGSLHASDSPSVLSCLSHETTLDECFWFYAAPADDVHADDVTCATTPIQSGAQITGHLNQNFSCRVTIPTSFGSLDDIADVYAFDAAAGTQVTISLASPDSFFGLPYIALINSAGTFVKTTVGTTSFGRGFRADLTYTIPTSGHWRLLVTGIGGPFSTAIGEYTLTFKIPVPPKRRAAHH